MTNPHRIQILADAPIRPGKYVLYWMQQSQRAFYNHALEYAATLANELRLPLVTIFGITDGYPEANERHYAFMLEGLVQTQKALRDRGIRMIVRHQDPAKAAIEMSADAAVLVVDRGYLRIQKEWRYRVANEADCRVVQVESDAVVPVDVASTKEEFAARTIRPRITRALEPFVVPLAQVKLANPSSGMKLAFEDEIDLSNVNSALAKLKIDRSVGRSTHFTGGYAEADRLLKLFLSKKLSKYDEERNQPTLDAVSHMSPYLHFGQISPLEILVRARGASAPDDAKAVYAEELIVRRELSFNFVTYNVDYDKYECLPAWARQTLKQHARDKREHLYSRDQFEQSRTHDPYWNAAQTEMVITGKMHNYMRMYWGKKILEWSATPEEAFATALYLNNKYELDGRDANSFAGVAWVFGKHDRPWTRRPVFGTIRYMNAAGLERKCDIKGYVKKVEMLKDGGLF